ncbi:UPF0149 family protein [uncultured Cedecea sp.]|uniref:UPF0149 family protein n=1 Tax=uncultured Cedecea sp. TaxID=988762 RepID=UPI0026123F7A|nr:UPF0149 family protein [uncultured Cedecea sp.]
MNQGPLSEDEIEWIDEVLAKYGIPDSVIDAAELDGLLTALLSMRDSFESAELWQALWGTLPEWESDAERIRFEALVYQHRQDIAERLEFYPTQFEPLFGSDEVDNREIVLVEEWCYGYMRGVMLTHRDDLPEELRPALAVIALHGIEENIVTINQMSPAAYLDSIDQIKPAVLSLYHYWLRRNSGQALH